MAIIKFILVFACCVYLIRLLMRIAMPLLLRHLFGKMQQNANSRSTISYISSFWTQPYSPSTFWQA